jgi:hypothetical protein
MINTPDEPPIYPPTPAALAAYLHDLLKNDAEEPEAIKAGIRYAILALRRMQRGFTEPH